MFCQTPPTHLQGLVNTPPLEVAGAEFTLATLRDFSVLGLRNAVASEAIDGRVDVAANGLADSLSSVRQTLKVRGSTRIYMTLCEKALDTFARGLAGVGAASGGSGASSGRGGGGGWNGVVGC